MRQAYLTTAGKIDIVVPDMAQDLECNIITEGYKNITGQDIEVEGTQKTVIKGAVSKECQLSLTDEPIFLQWTIAVGEDYVQLPNGANDRKLPSIDKLIKKGRLLVGKPSSEYQPEDPITSRTGVYRPDYVNNRIYFKAAFRRATYIKFIYKP